MTTTAEIISTPITVPVYNVPPPPYRSRLHSRLSRRVPYSARYTSANGPFIYLPGEQSELAQGIQLLRTLYEDIPQQLKYFQTYYDVLHVPTWQEFMRRMSFESDVLDILQAHQVWNEYAPGEILHSFTCRCRGCPKNLPAIPLSPNLDNGPVKGPMMPPFHVKASHPWVRLCATLHVRTYMLIRIWNQANQEGIQVVQPAYQEIKRFRVVVAKQIAHHKRLAVCAHRELDIVAIYEDLGKTPDEIKEVSEIGAATYKAARQACAQEELDLQDHSQVLKFLTEEPPRFSTVPPATFPGTRVIIPPPLPDSTATIKQEKPDETTPEVPQNPPAPPRQEAPSIQYLLAQPPKLDLQQQYVRAQQRPMTPHPRPQTVTTTLWQPPAPPVPQIPGANHDSSPSRI